MHFGFVICVFISIFFLLRNLLTEPCICVNERTKTNQPTNQPTNENEWMVEWINESKKLQNIQLKWLEQHWKSFTVLNESHFLVKVIHCILSISCPQHEINFYFFVLFLLNSFCKLVCLITRWFSIFWLRNLLTWTKPLILYKTWVRSGTGFTHN